MKINFVFGNDLKRFGGIQRHVVCLMKELKAKGIDINVLGRSSSDLLIAGKPLPSVKKCFSYFRSNENFHFFGFTCFYVAFFLKLVSKDAKIFYTPCMHPFDTHRHPFLAKAFFRIFLKPNFKKIDKLIVLSQFEFDFFKEFFDKSSITIIPSGIDRVNNLTDYKSGDYFLFVGRDDENKRLFLLEQLSETLQDIKFVFVTNTKKLNRLNTTYLNGVADAELEYLYSNAITTIVPSKYESFSIVALESLANGTPIIITENVQIKSFLDSSIMTVISEHNILENLTKAIQVHVNKIKNNTNIRKLSIESAERFLWKDIAEEHFKIYNGQ